jgi:hypothetical protein
MAQRVTLDAMIPREDFAVHDEQFDLDLFRDFPINNLLSESPIFKLLRKPDFQRETNQWTPEQIAIFIASFLDNEVIPSLILWKSPTFIFVIDGGHRLSALRAWIEDDYGDGAISLSFYKAGISDEQRKIAKRTRKIIEGKVGRYSTLRSLIEAKVSDDPIALRRANRLFTRALNLQWIQGNADVAETSFFKINSQGTPLDDTEEMLIRNRRKPIAIAARAILRSGTGHKYWSAFDSGNMSRIEELAEQFYQLLFEPESTAPLRTLEVPYGGSVSPVDALSLLIELLTIAGNRGSEIVTIDKWNDDNSGDATTAVMTRSLDVINRITGNSSCSLGLHPAVYFYNERGKYSRFLFLGVALLISEKIKNNDGGFFKKFTSARRSLEVFLVENKMIITFALQNMSKSQRVPKMRDLFQYLVDASGNGEVATAESAVAKLGLRGRIIDINVIQSAPQFSDDTKSMLFMSSALKAALKCPVCQGYLHPAKSVSYDHIVPVRSSGSGDVSNGQLVHPFCNTGIKS